MTDAVLYSTKFGATERAAKHIAESIGADLFDLCKTPDVDISKYDRVFLGSGVYAGLTSKATRNFVEKHNGEMSRISLFLTCMFKDAKGDEQLDKISKELGVADGIYFNNPKRQIGMDGSKLELYIESLRKG